MAKRYLIGLAAGAVIVGGGLTLVAVMGAEIGEPCDPEWECKGFNSVCLEGETKMCSKHCESASECPNGWVCEGVEVWSFDGKSQKPDVSSTPVCLPPREED